jgi:hypothetical protein
MFLFEPFLRPYVAASLKRQIAAYKRKPDNVLMAVISRDSADVGRATQQPVSEERRWPP